MHVLIWLTSGLVAGWLTGYALKGRGFGIVGSLLIGLAGGIVGGFLLHEVASVDDVGPLAHLLTSFTGSVTLLVVVRALDGAAHRVHRLTGSPLLGSPATDLGEQIRRLGELEREVLSRFFSRKPVTADANAVLDRETTIGERVADEVARFGGSWPFIGLFFLFMAAWMATNVTSAKPFDPYPFILLNLVLSCLAAMQAPVIMMSQNRQSVRDRLEAQNDYQVNLKAEMEILALHARLDALHEEEGERLLALHERQLAALERIESLLPSNGAGGAVEA